MYAWKPPVWVRTEMLSQLESRPKVCSSIGYFDVVRHRSVVSHVAQMAEGSGDGAPRESGRDGDQSQRRCGRKQPAEAPAEAFGHAVAQVRQMMAAAGLIHLD